MILQMVYKYTRKTERGSTWTEETMGSAIEAVQNGLSIRRAALKFHIPFSTLLKHIESNKTEKKLGRFKTVFTQEEEQEFVLHIKDLDNRFYGLTRKGLCELAHQYAEKNNIAHPFTNGIAGPQWYYNFMKRHPELSLRAPEPTSIARARGFNRPQVQRFFENLRAVMEKHNFSLANIYNVDETGIQTSAKRPPKVISLAGKKQVGSISSAERGTLITAVCCCSAAGGFIPPALIFPRKKRNPRYMEGAPPNSLDLVSDSGWITSETFLKWMEFFVAQVRPSENQKCLLILDNHSSHRSIQVLDYASQNHITILSVPPHTTHKLQPLDVSVYGPFGVYFEAEIDKWQKSHPAQHVTFFEIGRIFNNAYLKAATPSNAIKGFEKTGIAKCDMGVFTEADFLPADVTNIETDDNDVTTGEGNSALTSKPEDNVNKVNQNNDRIKEQSEEESKAGCSTQSESLSTGTVITRTTTNPKVNVKTPDKQENSEDLSRPGPSGLNVSNRIKLIDIHVLPKCEGRKPVKRRQTQKSEILTSTPVKEEIRTKNTTKNKASVKRKFEVDKDSEPTTKLSLKLPRPPSPIKVNPDDGETPCLLCSDTFRNSRPGEKWVQCNICESWAHALCSDYTSGVYICDICRTNVLNKRH